MWLVRRGRCQLFDVWLASAKGWEAYCDGGVQKNPNPGERARVDGHSDFTFHVHFSISLSFNAITECSSPVYRHFPRSYTGLDIAYYKALHRCIVSSSCSIYTGAGTRSAPPSHIRDTFQGYFPTSIAFYFRVSLSLTVTSPYLPRCWQRQYSGGIPSPTTRRFSKVVMRLDSNGNLDQRPKGSMARLQPSDILMADEKD